MQVGPGAGAASRPFIVVGTGFSGGEDVPTRGRILLLEVTRQMTGPNQATPQWSGRVSHAYEFKARTLQHPASSTFTCSLTDKTYHSQTFGSIQISYLVFGRLV